MRSLILAFACLAACTASEGTPTGATCETSAAPLTYDSFGKQFMMTYCTGCHASTVMGSMRHGAPHDDNFDTLEGVMAGASEIDGVAGAGPKANNADMPPGECTTCEKPSLQERTHLASWLACERASAH